MSRYQQHVVFNKLLAMLQRLKLVLHYGVLIGGLMGVTHDASALSAQEIYRQAEHQVFILEVLNEKGEAFSYHTAVLIEADTLATQCESVQGAPSLQLRQGTEIYPTQIARTVFLHAPGVGASGVKLRDDTPPAGTPVYAVSNALGLGIGITSGVVSGVRAAQGEIFIQHTAAIAPGSEGGGLFDTEGRLLGLISYRQRDGQNVNFAIPAQWLKEISQRAASADAAEAWRVKALDLERSAKWDDLAAHAMAWSKALADSTEAWLWLGSAQTQRRDWPAAELAYREALRHEPSTIQGGGLRWRGCC